MPLQQPSFVQSSEEKRLQREIERGSESESERGCGSYNWFLNDRRTKELRKRKRWQCCK